MDPVNGNESKPELEVTAACVLSQFLFKLFWLEHT